MNKHSSLFARGVLLVGCSVSLFWACTKTKYEISPALTVTDTINEGVKMGPIRPVTNSSNAYVTSFFQFTPAPGQFINTGISDTTSDGYEGAMSVLGGTAGLVSLGAWGGYVVYGFDHTVIDTAGADLWVEGNPLANFAEPGIIWVMQDQNGNGKPDDTWYELAGSETGKAGNIRNYAVTYYRPTPNDTADVFWKDNQGDSGYVDHIVFHQQSYYPKNQANSYTLYGTLAPSVNIDMSDPSYIQSFPFTLGYCDNTVGGDYVDISTAIDSLGRPAKLKGIDFIKIQTGIQANMGWLGELSTEVCGIGDISIMNKNQ